MTLYRCCQVGGTRVIHTWNRRFGQILPGRGSSAFREVNAQRMSSVAAIKMQILCTQMKRKTNKLLPYMSLSSSSKYYSSNTDVAPLGELIYTGPATTIVKAVKFFSLSTSILAMAIIPILVNQPGNDVLTYIGGILGLVVFITPVLLHTMARTYVIRMYYNPMMDTYTAVTLTLLLRDKMLPFKPEDVQVPGIANLLTTFNAKGRSLLVDPQAFTNPNDYNHIMGYDKFERFNLDEIEKESEDKLKP